MPSTGLGSRKHTTKRSTCTKDSRARTTSRAYSDADPGLVCPVAAASAAAAAAAAAIVATSVAAADDFGFLEIMNTDVTETSRIHTTTFVDVLSCWFRIIRMRPA